MKWYLTLILFALSFLPITSFAQRSSWQVGDKVEAWNVSWYKATIVEVGVGERAGDYKVHYDDFSAASDHWIKARDKNPRIRARTMEKAQDRATLPRLGKYRILSYGPPTNPPLFLGFVELQPSGRYQVQDGKGRPTGAGTYSFHAATSSIKWLNGPYKKSEWKGDFSIKREGKTHEIRLFGRGTIAINSVD